MAAKITTTTAILMLILFSVGTGLPQTSVVSDCQANEDCLSSEVCISGECQNLCQFVMCGSNTVCYTSNHIGTCACPPGTIWDPSTGCKHLERSCITNINCDLDEVCHDNKCQNPCRTDTAPCGANTVCVTHNHTVMCYCRTDHNDNTDTGCVENKNSAIVKKFKFCTHKKRTWQEALDHCNSMGMKLATINSQEEQDTVYILTKDWAWLGGSDLEDTGNYTWSSTNSTITYTNWDQQQPNNYKHTDGSEDHCIIMVPDGKWWDTTCNDQRYSVCEYYE